MRFLEKIDDVPTHEHSIRAVAVWFVEARFENPGMVAGLSANDICWRGGPLPLESILEKRLMERALTLINKRFQAKARAQRKSLQVRECLRQEIDVGGYRPILPSMVGFTKVAAEMQKQEAAVEEKTDEEHDVYVLVEGHDGLEFSVRCNLRETVDQFKGRIAGIADIPSQQLGLALGYTIVGEGDSLVEDYGIKSGARLSYFLQPEISDFQDNEGMRAELDAMKTGALISRAVTLGVDEDLLEEAVNASDKKTALVELIWTMSREK